jgi:hypothetical protein
MAFVVVRPRGRFEIRESVHTPNGPRARTLANFEHLTDKVLDTARQRATRPFDLDAVRVSAFRAGKKANAQRADRKPLGGVAEPRRPELRRFAESSRRMAASLDSWPQATSDRDPGDALIDLLDLTAQIPTFKGPRRPDPLQFPSLARLRAARMGQTGQTGHTDRPSR